MIYAVLLLALNVFKNYWYLCKLCEIT